MSPPPPPSLSLLVFFSIWDIEEGSRLVTEHYNSQARITAAEFVNPHDITFLLTGSGQPSTHAHTLASSLLITREHFLDLELHNIIIAAQSGCRKSVT